MTTRPHDDGDFRVEFAVRFGTLWAMPGASALEGRIAGYLLLDSSGGVSAAELSDTLGISTGTVSTATRRLIDAGFVRRVRRPGSRADGFVMDADVWAGFLEREYAYLRAQRELAAAALTHVDPGTDAHARVTNMHDYMSWLIDDVDLAAAWSRHRERLRSNRE
ncbi:MarR family transcriptional regulator [Brevibacterium casei]|nr:MarR family transcriptional regulator [Brevibacterium casei]